MAIKDKLLELMIECRNEPAHIGLPIQRALGVIVRENFRGGDTIQQVTAIVQNLDAAPTIQTTQTTAAQPRTFTADNFQKKPLPTVSRRAVGRDGKTEVTEAMVGEPVDKRMFAKQKTERDAKLAKEQEDAALAASLQVEPPATADTTLDEEAETKIISERIAVIADKDLPGMKALYSNKQRALQASDFLFKEGPEDHKSITYVGLLKWMIEKAQEHVNN